MLKTSLIGPSLACALISSSQAPMMVPTLSNLRCRLTTLALRVMSSLSTASLAMSAREVPLQWSMVEFMWKSTSAYPEQNIDLTSETRKCVTLALSSSLTPRVISLPAAMSKLQKTMENARMIPSLTQFMIRGHPRLFSMTMTISPVELRFLSFTAWLPKLTIYTKTTMIN